MRHLTGFSCALLLLAACHNGKSTQPTPVAQVEAPAAVTPASAPAPAAATAPASVTSAAPAPVATASYSCPMHADVSAKEPGKCPKCGMALVASSAAPEAPAKK